MLRIRGLEQAHRAARAGGHAGRLRRHPGRAALERREVVDPQPHLEPVLGPNGGIANVRIAYPLDFTRQMLEYADRTPRR